MPNEGFKLTNFYPQQCQARLATLLPTSSEQGLHSVDPDWRGCAGVTSRVGCARRVHGMLLLIICGLAQRLITITLCSTRQRSALTIVNSLNESWERSDRSAFKDAGRYGQANAAILIRAAGTRLPELCQFRQNAAGKQFAVATASVPESALRPDEAPCRRQQRSDHQMRLQQASPVCG
jgi:hypothetical protein